MLECSDFCARIKKRVLSLRSTLVLFIRPFLPCIIIYLDFSTLGTLFLLFFTRQNAYFPTHTVSIYWKKDLCIFFVQFCDWLVYLQIYTVFFLSELVKLLFTFCLLYWSISYILISLTQTAIGCLAILYPLIYYLYTLLSACKVSILYLVSILWLIHTLN